MILFIIIVLTLLAFRYAFYWKGMDLNRIYKDKVIYLGHRGLRYQAPENTVSSYRKAIDHGFAALELDVRITKDRKLLCSHNLDLERETLGEGYVDEILYEEIIKIKAGRAFSNKEQRGIPLLTDVLAELPGNILLNIEIKSDSFFDLRAAKELIKIIKTNKIKQQLIVSSFNPLVVRYIKIMTTDIPTGYIYEFAKHFKGVFLARPDCLHPEAEFIDNELIRFCQKRKMNINAWTVNNRYAKEWLISKGVQGIITDNPNIID